MKQLKRWISALLIWEFVALWHKDANFKKKIKKAQWPASKFKIIFDWLFDFNKKIIDDLQHTNLEEMKGKAINWFEKETLSLEETLSQREANFENRSDEKLPIYLMWLETQFDKFETKALKWKDKIIDDYELESKVQIFKKRISKARNEYDSKSKS